MSDTDPPEFANLRVGNIDVGDLGGSPLTELELGCLWAYDLGIDVNVYLSYRESGLTHSQVGRFVIYHPDGVSLPDPDQFELLPPAA